MPDPIRVQGLREFQRGLRRLDSGLSKALRLAFNEAAGVIISDATPLIPVRSGKARASMKARSTQTLVRITAGGNKAPYYPWLDFGGRVGPSKSVRRPFLKNGRYIYNAYFRRKTEFIDILEEKMINLAREAGIEVS